ncbi:MAG: hypothetical protein JJU06_17160 [Ectothiorhodospiraceae bacterium]|nr:hypothetical protein [Ectothiorhodospiraceae bacterium]MCH8504848.1 hypothetical protein [Ectothiorhodospiraceae bacterium]
MELWMLPFAIVLAAVFAKVFSKDGEKLSVREAIAIGATGTAITVAIDALRGAL